MTENTEITLLRKRADQGDAEARYALGKLYLEGASVNEDKIQAYVWLSLAIAAGKDASKERDEIAGQMTTAQTKEANRQIIARQRGKEQKVLNDAENLLQLILTGVADEKGVHIQTVFSLLGALTGFATQMAVREKLIVLEHKKEDEIFKVMVENGQRYYLGGDMINRLLVIEKDRVSLLSVVSATAKSLGAKIVMPNPDLLIEHIVKSFGKETFGVPRLSPALMPRFMPFEMLRDTWDTVAVALKLADEGNPLSWPYTLIGATKLFILKTKGVIDPNTIVPMVIESTVPMSHVDPALVCGQSELRGKKRIDLGRTERGQFLQSDAFKNALENARKKEAAESK